MRRIKKAVSIILCICFILSMTACASTSQSNPAANPESNQNNNETTPEAEKQPRGEQVLRVSGSEPRSIDPHKRSNAYDTSMIYYMQESLVKVKEDGYAPGIAEKWDISDDGKVYTFYLRDALWSDGQKITAQDFEYSYKRFLNPETGATAANLGYYILNGLPVNKGTMESDALGVKAIDEKTLQITLENQTAFFMELLGRMAQFQPVRQDIVEKYGEEFASSPDKLFYSGPYVLSEWVRENYMVLVKNDNYWNKDAVKMDRIEIKVLSDANTAAAMFDNGELDIVSSINATEYKARIGQAVTFYTGGIEYLALNNKRPVFANLNFRKALSYAFDREIFAALGAEGLMDPYGRFCLDFGKGYEKLYGEEYPIDVISFKADKEKAKEHLEKAFNELNMKAEDINIELLISENQKSKGEVIQAAFNDVLGIKVAVKQMPQAQRLELMSKAEYDMTLTGWVIGYDDPTYNLDLYETANSHEQSQYSNPEFDALVEKAKTLPQGKERYDILFEAEKILINDLPAIPLGLTKNAYLVNENLRNVYRGIRMPSSAFAWVNWAE